MNRSYRFIVLASIVIVAIFFINAEKNVNKSVTEAQVLVDSSGNGQYTYKIKALKIPENLNFCGEKVALDKTDIYERIDRELLINTYWQSNTLLFIKRSNRWFPIIEKILLEENVPNDFKYLALKYSKLWYFLT